MINFLNNSKVATNHLVSLKLAPEKLIYLEWGCRWSHAFGNVAKPHLRVHGIVYQMQNMPRLDPLLWPFSLSATLLECFTPLAPITQQTAAQPKITMQGINKHCL